MQINSINTNNNSPSFQRVIFHDKKTIAKLGKNAVDKLLNSEVVQSFSKRNDYNLHIKLQNKSFYYKIKSKKQGLQGMINNFVAPWKHFISNVTNIENTSSYIEIWHPSKQEVLAEKLAQQKTKAEAKVRLKQINAERKKEEIISYNALVNIEKSKNN